MTIAIFCIIKNEHPYIKEWVDYHLNLGVNHIYLFEDVGSKSHSDIFTGYDNVSVIDIVKSDIILHLGSLRLTDLFNYCIQTYKNQYDYGLFTDPDEFLMFKDGYLLLKLLEDFKEYNGVYLAWKMYNANGHVNRKPDNISTIDYYTTTCKHIPYGSVENNVKSLVNFHKDGRIARVHCVTGGVSVDGSTKPKFYSDLDVAWLNHYFTKSFEDYCYRMFVKGNLSSAVNFNNFFICNPDLAERRDELMESVKDCKVVHVQWHVKSIGGQGNVPVIKMLNKGLL